MTDGIGNVRNAGEHNLLTAIANALQSLDMDYYNKAARWASKYGVAILPPAEPTVPYPTQAREMVDREIRVAAAGTVLKRLEDRIRHAIAEDGAPVTVDAGCATERKSPDKGSPDNTLKTPFAAKCVGEAAVAAERAKWVGYPGELEAAIRAAREESAMNHRLRVARILDAIPDPLFVTLFRSSR